MSTKGFFSRNVEERRAPGMHNTTPPATSASLAPHTLAMSCYGYDSRKPKKCRKQLNGHLSFQTTITNRLESTFPPHLCKKIKFVPHSQQPFENGRIFNLAVGLSREIVSRASTRESPVAAPHADPAPGANGVGKGRNAGGDPEGQTHWVGGDLVKAFTVHYWG